MTKRAALYLRISALDKGQTTENQRRELTAYAEQRGWAIVREYEDLGISGATGRDQRPQLDAMLKDVTSLRRKFDVLMVWSLDRLGRSLQDLITFLSEIQAAGIELILL